MINKENFKALLRHLNYEKHGDIYTKHFSDCSLSVDFINEQLQYPETKGLKINERQTCNFSSAENAVVFECVHKLLEKGYKPNHLELEPKWKVGHGASGGRADILVKNQESKPLLIIECKTYGREFEKAWKDTLDDGGQLFSYAQQISETEYLCLYASEFDTKRLELSVSQRIIPHKDNEKIIELGDGLKTYNSASNVKNRFDVWKETYQLEYTEKGIFEENIQAYQIGKNHYTLDIDTKPVAEQDKIGKYHKFRTILRQHNVARRETAFEVLVNLFLAKIVDEEENKNNLEFYWKGIAYDNYYDFIDRLQKLYQTGMHKFLKDDVMYISNEQIDGAFWTIKNKRNATKQQIQKYFRNLKFYSNNAFSLINVHNEKGFNKNTKVLVELVQMWQGLRLKTEEQNQFLGDMFEYFLDNSIKQSEGQFFTPMPITKFIVASLPLEYKIQGSTEPLKAIDYACGSGHFLNEYAHQITPLVKQHKQADISSYYQNITGIEKEDRLAKIAKVSAYMYGQDQINIIEEDALSDLDEVKQSSFDVLVANPPFAVKGFLLNLSDKQKENYDLIRTTDTNSDTNNIQCFFIERAKQLMARGGVMGVIVPSSILSNSDGTHIATREIILKYFDIVALVELGSGTFGKTGTNTVVLFLRRKDKRPEPAEHYKNRVEDYFLGEDADEGEYQDKGLIKAYCQHNELPFDEYIKLFGITANNISSIDELLTIDVFIEYKNSFDNSTEIKNLKKAKNFKGKSEQEKQLELDSRLIDYLYKIEKDKLYYFMLVYENQQKVLIVKSPSDNKKQKQFLGYEWSGAKGSEGIQYNGGSTVNDIVTPLFNPNNLQDKTKINSLIEKNFLGEPLNDLTEFRDYKDLISYANVQDILDFSRVGFNKAFSLTPKKNIAIETKWDLVKIDEICELGRGRVISHDYINENKGEYPVYSSQTQNNGVMGKINSFDFEGEYVTWTTDGVYAGTCSYRKGRFNCTNVCGTLRQKTDEINIQYLPLVLNTVTHNYVVKSANPKLMNNVMADIKIPLPPKETQEQIVAECEIIDNAVEQAKETIEKVKEEIEETVTQPQKQQIKLDDAVIKITNAIDSTNKRGEVNYIGLENIESKSGSLIGNIKSDYSEIKSNKTKYQISDILYGKLRPNLNKVYLTKDTGICSTDILVFRPKNINLSNYYKHYFLSRIFNNQVLATVSGQQLPRTSWDKIKNFQIPIPPLPEQNKLVAEIKVLEQKIEEAQTIVEEAPKQKQLILDKYLK